MVVYKFFLLGRNEFLLIGSFGPPREHIRHMFEGCTEEHFIIVFDLVIKKMQEESLY